MTGTFRLDDDLWAAAQRWPNKTAVLGVSEAFTYEALADRARGWAHALAEAGVTAGDRVLLWLREPEEVVAAVYGTLRLGATFVPIDGRAPQARAADVARDADAAAWATDREDGPADGLGRVHPADVTGMASAPVGATDSFNLAGLLYTSGSTGTPKGVMLSHLNMLFARASVAHALGLRRDDVIMNALPLSFDYGLYQALMSVHLGATVALEATFGFPAAVARRIQTHAATVVPGVPTTFVSFLRLFERSGVSLPTVRLLTNTAAHLPSEHVRRLQGPFPRAQVALMYGQTECKRVSVLNPSRDGRRVDSVGRPLPGTSVLLLDDDGQPVPDGEVGTLHVRGPHVMLGYWRRPEATAEKLVPSGRPGERMLKTHDLFIRDGDGLLHFVSRRDDVINRGGVKVAPTAVEEAIGAIDGVVEAAVVGVAGGPLGETLRAYVVRRQAGHPSAVTIKKAVASRLDAHHVPQDVRFLDRLPRTENGKVDRRRLAQRSHERAASQPAREEVTRDAR